MLLTVGGIIIGGIATYGLAILIHKMHHWGVEMGIVQDKDDKRE